MSTSTLPFLISKAHAYHSQSPTLQNIMAMVQTESISEIENILQNTHYRDVVLQKRPSVNLTDFEVALRRDFAKLLTRYIQAASPDVRSILEAYAQTIEADNMNMILQTILRNNTREGLIQSIIPVGKYGIDYYERMMGTTKVEAAIDFIINPKIKREVRKSLTKSTDIDDRAFYLSAALSHTSYELLQEVAPKWVKIYVEILNLETVARGVQMGINPKLWMIPNNGIVNQNLQTLSSMKTVREIFSYIKDKFPVKYLVEQALMANDEDIVSEFEQYALSHRFYQHQRNFKIFGNRKESILDFFVIKKAEIEDISRILLSTQKSIPSEKIMGMLMTPIYRRN